MGTFKCRLIIRIHPVTQCWSHRDCWHRSSAQYWLCATCKCIYYYCYVPL